MVRELPPLEIPNWMTVEHIYDCDDAAAARAIAYLISHPVSGLPLSDALPGVGAQDDSQRSTHAPSAAEPIAPDRSEHRDGHDHPLAGQRLATNRTPRQRARVDSSRTARALTKTHERSDCT